MPLVFYTLGPCGTCHDNALKHYFQFHGLTDTRVVFVDDFLVALERVRQGDGDFIMQNSAHTQVVEVTEKYHREVFVVDSFVFPTQEMGVLTRREVDRPKSLGIMPATRGYIDTSRWETVVTETAKPIVARNLLAGTYDSGLTFLRYAEQNPDRLRIDYVIGSVDTAWLLYGRRRRCCGQIIGVRDPALFAET